MYGVAQSAVISCSVSQQRLDQPLYTHILQCMAHASASSGFRTLCAALGEDRWTVRAELPFSVLVSRSNAVGLIKDVTSCTRAELSVKFIPHNINRLDPETHLWIRDGSCQGLLTT